MGRDFFFFFDTPLPHMKAATFLRPTNETFPTSLCLPEGPCKLSPCRKNLKLKEESEKENVAEHKLCFLLFENFIPLNFNSIRRAGRVLARC